MIAEFLFWVNYGFKIQMHLERLAFDILFNTSAGIFCRKTPHAHTNALNYTQLVLENPFHS